MPTLHVTHSSGHQRYISHMSTPRVASVCGMGCRVLCKLPGLLQFGEHASEQSTGRAHSLAWPPEVLGRLCHVCGLRPSDVCKAGVVTATWEGGSAMVKGMPGVDMQQMLIFLCFFILQTLFLD